MEIERKGNKIQIELSNLDRIIPNKFISKSILLIILKKTIFFRFFFIQVFALFLLFFKIKR